MAKRKRSVKSDSSGAQPTASLEQSFNRIANLLALLLVKGENETQKVVALTGVGFSPVEIGRLLGKQANTVSVILYQAKKQKKK